MAFWRNINPTGALADFVTVYRQAGKNRLPISIASLLITTGLFTALTHESWRKPEARPEITYITSWIGHRSDEEIIASNLANQKYQDRLAAEQAKREEDVRNIYKAVGRASGMDVDAIEKQAAADEAAAKARAAATLNQQQAAARSE